MNDKFLNAAQFWKKLEAKAKEIGFAQIAAAPVTILQKEGKILEKWLKEGNAGEMEYMLQTKDVRKEPHKFLTNARSVIVATVDYFQEYKKPKFVSPQGKIARYAAGRDYHKVIKKMLFELQQFLQEEFFPNTQNKDFRLSLDAHPVMERVWAERSGLGFLGKNSCLITEKGGSWVLLGALFTTQNIPEKPKDLKKLAFAKLSCGNCTRCIRACPTGAIIAPGKIDARKCISYLTIENKAGIPLEFREKIGDRLFGCDICQEVCPFNIPRQKKATSPLMEKQIAGTELLLQEVLQIETDAEFLQRFAGSPLMRAKRRGLLRNACVVAGNSRNKNLLPLLKKVHEREKDEILREHAAWAIQTIQNEECRIKNSSQFPTARRAVFLPKFP